MSELSRHDDNSETFQRQPPRLLPNFKSARVGKLSKESLTGAKEQ